MARIRFAAGLVLGCAGAMAWPAALAGQEGSGRTYCNPIDLDYKYNFEQQHEGISYRSGADPVIVRHRDEYYLFVTVVRRLLALERPAELAVREAEPLAVRGQRGAGGPLGAATRCSSCSRR